MVSRLRAAGVVEVELLEALAGREPGGADTAFPAVAVAGGYLPLQAGDQELFMGPGLGPGPVGQPRHRVPQRGRFERPGQERHLGGDIPLRGLGCGGGHHATPPSMPSSAS